MRAERTVLLEVAYDGRPFHGWAPQANARTVAGDLLGAIRAMDPSVRALRGASRTDAGVHARGQVVAFETSLGVQPRGWVLGLAAHLPGEIAVRRAALSSHGLVPHASARGKVYRYLVLRDRLRDPHWEGRAWRVGWRLDVDRARAEAAALVGTHDFAAFRAAGDDRPQTVRTIDRVEVGEDARDARLLAIEVAGTAFLHKMVRIVVGALVEAARGAIAPGACARALASRRRADLGPTAPAEGLYLERVILDAPREDAWPD